VTDSTLPGRAVSPVPGDHLVAIDRRECVRLLQTARGFGRIGATVHGRAVIYPVNFIVHRDTVLFRTRTGGELAEATNNVVVAFEVDQKEALYHEGWSVLVTGLATHVTEPTEIGQLSHLALTPWAGEARDCYVRIALDEISGRRISHGVR